MNCDVHVEPFSVTVINIVNIWWVTCECRRPKLSMSAHTQTTTTVRRSSRQSRTSNDLGAEENHSVLSVPMPSEKALGKRPERPRRAIVTTEHAQTPPNEPQVKKATRVLPSRSSRHAPGLGNSSIDELIADAQQRAGEKSIHGWFVSQTDM